MDPFLPTHVTISRPAPLLNTPHFGEVFGKNSLPLDKKGLLRQLEMIALVGTQFTVLEGLEKNIARVETADYPGELYLDLRFTQPLGFDSPPIPKRSVAPIDVVENLKSCLGLPYVWGGNWKRGIPEIIDWYAPHISLQDPLYWHWTLQGLDCSGLLYESTSGFTPRNTSQLLLFGEEIASLSPLKPLDLFIWPGHVVILLDRYTTIESRYGAGVVLSDLSVRLAEMEKHPYSIRRFI